MNFRQEQPLTSACEALRRLGGGTCLGAWMVSSLLSCSFLPLCLSFFSISISSQMLFSKTDYLETGRHPQLCPELLK